MKDIYCHVVLPPLSQIDMEVWDALPLITRRELENEYKLQECPQIRANKPLGKRKRRQLGKTCARSKENRQARNKPSKKAPRLTSVCSSLTLSQIDPEVLESLPIEIQKEIAESIAPHRIRKDFNLVDLVPQQPLPNKEMHISEPEKTNLVEDKQIVTGQCPYFQHQKHLPYCV